MYLSTYLCVQYFSRAQADPPHTRMGHQRAQITRQGDDDDDDDGSDVDDDDDVIDGNDVYI